MVPSLTRHTAEPATAVTRTRLAALWRAGVDAAAVLVFAATGRASHAEALSPGGVLATAGPFLVGLGLGWGLLRWRPDLVPAGSLREGVLLAGTTLIGGMALRALLGAGTAPAFVVVAAVVLLALLPGWRLLARLATRLRRR
ncbi:DUF3054 domain-containing protein [Ornithinicoccus halotolerans]|uniref:DUF3054 domain-containing protein n=1 Tax=Ornithinicoccus halotolerans TaxID=1748220 RepID=UPI001295A819|nr:DUF3054 domain-containing protein [Ornithinicoccus halotolerans]